MKVLVLKNSNLKEKNIKNTLEELQKIVGGYIEMPYLSKRFAENDIDIIINEEGKLIDGMTPEIAVVKGAENQVIDVVYGNCIFTSHNDMGETVGLNDKQIAIIKEELQYCGVLENRRNGKSYSVRLLHV